MRWIILSLGLCAGLPGISLATKYAGEFMYVGAGARSLALGGAYSALAGDVTTAYWNPAGLYALEGQQAVFMHSERFGGLISYDYLAYGRSNGRVGLAASLFRTDAGKIADTTNLQFYDTGSDGVFGLDGSGEPGDVGNDDYDPDTNPGGTEGNNEWDPGEEIIYDEGRITWKSAVDWALYLSWSRLFTTEISAGASAKVIQRGLMDNSAFGLGLDIGARWQPAESFSVGLNLQDVFGTYLFWDTGQTEVVIPTAKIGFAVQWPLRKFGTVATFLCDGDFRFEGRKCSAQYSFGDVSLDTHFGAEFLIKDRVALRLGSSEGNMTAGLGIQIGLFRLPVALDYAYLSHEDLDNTHRVSLGVGF